MLANKFCQSNADLSVTSWQTYAQSFLINRGFRKAEERFLDKIFVDEAVAELRTIQDMLRWTMSRFNAADIYYGHGSDNAWDEAL